MGLEEADLVHLRRCVELAREGLADGDARLFAELQHARQQQESDRRFAGRFQAGFRGRRRRRHLFEDRDRCEVLHPAGFRHCRPDPPSGRYPEQGRQRPAHAGSLPDGPELVRGFAPNGIGPRDINPFGTRDALGGTKYWGASFELQMPFWFLPKEVGLKGSVYADAGGLWDYRGTTGWAPTGEVNVPGCIPPDQSRPPCRDLPWICSMPTRTSSVPRLVLA